MVEARNLEVPSGMKLPIGQTISSTLHVFRGAPFKFLLLILLPVPFSMATGVAKAFAARSHGAQVFILLGILFLIQYTATLISQGAIMVGASRLYLDARGRFGVAEVVRVALRRFFPLLGVVILATIIVGLGLVLLIVPGIIFGLMLSVSFPACAIEGLGPIESLRRSRALTSGNRWRILGTVLLIAVVPFIVLLAVAATLVALHLAIVGTVLAVIGGLLLAVILAGFPAVLFLALRDVKEGRR